MEENVLEEKIIEETSASIKEMLQQDMNDNIEDIDDNVEIRKLSNIYRGKAFNDVELYQMTANQKTQVILVAGVFHSGKTTMELALFQMFLRGANKKLQFAGSRTLVDVVERSKGLRFVSGNSSPEVMRTSKAISDSYLHISIVDGKGIKHNLIFTDLAGEVFDYTTSSDNDNYLKKFVGVSHVIILIDGEKIAGRLKNQALYECKNVLTRLLQEKIISDYTTVHIVYSKNDMILKSKNPNLDEIIRQNNDKLKKMLGNRQGKFVIHRVAAISVDTDKACNYEGLEELIESCLVETRTRQQKSVICYADKESAQSSFDKFAWKG